MNIYEQRQQARVKAAEEALRPYLPSDTARELAGVVLRSADNAGLEFVIGQYRPDLAEEGDPD